MALVEQIIIQDGATATLRQIDSALDATAQRVTRLGNATTTSAGQTRFAVQNLSFQLNDIATSLASGGSPFRVLAQQGGQIVQVFQQGGGVSNVLSATAASIRSMITPTTAAVAGVAALAGSFAFLVSRAAAATEQVRQYNLLASQVGRGASISTGALATSNAALRTQGISASLAEQQRLAILRNSSLNPASGDALQFTGAGVGAALGLGAEAGFQRLLSTIQSGPQATINFAQQLGALSDKQAQALSASAALTGGLKEQNTALDALRDKYKTFARDAMTPFEEATNRLGGAWDNFLTKLQNTTAIQGAEQALKDMLNGIAGVLSGEKKTILQQGMEDLGKTLPAYDTAEREQTLRDASRAPRFPVMPPSGNVPFPTIQNPNVGMPTQFPDPNNLSPGWRMEPAPAGAFNPNNPFATSLTTGFWRSGSQIAGAGRSTLGVPITGASGAAIGLDPDKVNAAAASLARLKQSRLEDVAAAQKWNVEQQAAGAYTQAYNEFIRNGATEEQARTAATEAATKARQLHNAEISKGNTLAEMEISGTRLVTEALKVSEEQANKVTAAEQARIEVRQRGGDRALRTAQIEAATFAKTAQDLQRAANENERRVDLVNLEASLQGKTSEEIARQVTLLQAKQELQRRGVPLTAEEAKNYMASAYALAQANANAAAITREQQRLDDAVRSVAGTVENTLGSAFEDIFSGRKIDDWGARLKSIIGSVLSDIIKFTLIRPAIGTALGSLGFASVAQQYGGFGGSSGGGSIFSLGNISSAASLGNTAFGGGGGMLGGIGSFIDSSIGPALGFSSLPGAGTAGIPLASAGGLFGATTLSSVLPFVGLALGGGFLLSQLFGNKRPSNASAGGLIDFSTGRIGSSFTGGNSQIDSSTQQLISQVSTFTKSLLDLSGGSLSGSVLLQGGVNTGFTADSTLAPFLGRFNLGKDPTQAANLVQLALIRSLTDISDAMKTVLDQVSDPAAIEGALQFAAAYDAMKLSFDNFNAGIEDIANDNGPYAQAKKQVEDTFAGLIEQAQQYGLALEPINFGLQEALDTLWTEFTQPLQDFADSLRGGELSGLSTAAQLTAANDNFNKTLALVQGGNADEIGNLLTYGQQSIALSQQAYGNAPQTAGLRDDMLSAIDAVLADRSFASGGVTPPGMIRVGEHGPEWMMQPGGATVYPTGVNPPGMDFTRLEGLLGRLIAVAQGVGVDTVARLEALLDAATQPQMVEPPRRAVS